MPLSGYQQIVEAVSAAARGERADRPRDPRQDLADKIAGTAIYPTDTRIDDALVGRILWSAYASARIVEIDIAAARSVPGVVAVLTHRDVPGRNISGETLFGTVQPLLAVDRVRSMEDAVVLIAARTDHAARAALRQVRVHYEPDSPILDVLDAIAEGAPHIGAKGNVIAQFVERHGDVEPAFLAAKTVVEGEYRSEPNDHVCLEPEGGVGVWEDDRLRLTITSLTPHSVRISVARALGIELSRVRIETPRMGGSFGKYLTPGIECQLALLVAHTRQPVRLVLDRSEIFPRRPKRHPFWGHYRLALNASHRFTALEADVIADAGPYASLTPAVISVFAAEVLGAYDIPNFKVLARGVLTNNLLTAAMRGFGSQQINFGIESLVEKAARAAGIDALELRRRNYTRTHKDGSGRDIAMARPSLDATMDIVCERMGPLPQAGPGQWVGRGFSSVKCKYGYPFGMVDRFLVRVTLERGGEFVLDSDVPDSGTGIGASAARLAARTLGLDVMPTVRVAAEIIADPSGTLFASGRGPSPFQQWLFGRIESVQRLQALHSISLTLKLKPAREAWFLKTFAVPINLLNALINRCKSTLFPSSIDGFVPRTSGSRGIMMVGTAAVAVAQDFRRKALALAARKLGVAESELSVNATGIMAKSGRTELTWAELSERAGGPLAGIGDAVIPRGQLFDPATGNQMGSVDFQYASHGCDLAVDRETGAVTILRYVAAQDVGRALNSEIVRGQIHGAITMGIGQALWEKLFAADGAVTNGRLHDYLVPTALDAPRNPIIVIYESGEGAGPEGAKGCGEAGAVAAPIAVANALYDALGVQVARIPATPEEILDAVARSGLIERTAL